MTFFNVTTGTRWRETTPLEKAEFRLRTAMGDEAFSALMSYLELRDAETARLVSEALSRRNADILRTVTSGLRAYQVPST